MKLQLSLLFRKFKVRSFILLLLFVSAAAVIACSNMFNDIHDGSRLRVGIFLSSFGSGCQLFTLDSNGNFIDRSDKLPALPLNIFAATTLDYDSDGSADIAIVYSTNLIMLSGKDDGSFKINFEENLSLNSPQDICYDDFNSDGKLDLAIVDTGSNQVIIYTRGLIPLSFPAGTDPMPIDKGNLNGDGKIDLYTGSTGSNNNQIFINNSGVNVNFTPIQHTTIVETNDSKLLDINNDRLSDLIITDNSGYIRIFKNSGNANFTEIQNINIPDAYYITTGDLDGDVDIDALIGNGVGPAGALINNGNGIFTYKTVFMLVKSLLFDIDYDGDLDIIGYKNTDLYLLKNDGHGNFNLHSTVATISPNDIDLFTYHAED